MYFGDGRAYLSYKSIEYAWRHNFVIIIPWIRNKQGKLSIHFSFFGGMTIEMHWQWDILGKVLKEWMEFSIP